ncbi:MAG: cytochrome c oxidase subunit 3 [Gammaproteobacteria bacterium]|nr:cytochrome c oxidase subunit 3 [Gammaproteobacteria bacterium]
MITIIIFIFAAVGISYWWLLRQRVLEKPWLTEGTGVDRREDLASESPTAKTGLIVFLAVVTSMFSLFISAYFMRMELNDWRPLDEPGLLWFNTLLLILGSLSIHKCARSAANQDANGVKVTLLATGIFTGAFVAGQLIAWQQLNEAGYALRSNPANAFFYLFTGIHGLHLLGGLWVWSRTSIRVLAGVELEQIKLSVELCRNYWHFLLVVWIVIFALLLST